MPGSRTALAELCRLYWFPLYAFVRRRGYNAEAAQDLTQGFFFSLLERKSLQKVAPQKGKFRSFLLASLKNYLADQLDRENSIKRGGQIEFVALDLDGGEERYSEDLSGSLTGEKIFDARWALTILREALKQLSQEYAAAGKTSTFEALKVFLDPNNCMAPTSYDEVANRLQITTGAIKTLIHRLRKRYTALLREEVGRTVSDPAEIDGEIHALCEALIASEGRLDP
jgi:RNA polymerase sigma factor (sigma-70 family)